MQMNILKDLKSSIKKRLFNFGNPAFPTQIWKTKWITCLKEIFVIKNENNSVIYILGSQMMKYSSSLIKMS